MTAYARLRQDMGLTGSPPSRGRRPWNLSKVEALFKRHGVDRDRRALADLERRQLLAAERLRAHAERLHEIERQDHLAGARAVHQALGDADAVAEGDELLGGDRPGHAEHRFAEVQRGRDRRRQAEILLPLLAERAELALQVLSASQRAVGVRLALAGGE